MAENRSGLGRFSNWDGAPTCSRLWTGESRRNGCKAGARVPGLVYRVKGPDGIVTPTVAELPGRLRRGAKGREANVRPKEHKWAVRQDVGGEQASTREAQQSLTAFCRAQRRERKEQTLTRGDPGAERRQGVSRGHSSV